jgi:hypothetical protein
MSMNDDEKADPKDKDYGPVRVVLESLGLQKFVDQFMDQEVSIGDHDLAHAFLTYRSPNIADRFPHFQNAGRWGLENPGRAHLGSTEKDPEGNI